VNKTQFSSPKLTIPHHRAGKTVLSALESKGLDTAGIEVISDVNSKVRTAQYVAINDVKKDLVLAMADMSLFATRDHLLSRSGLSPKWSVVDANWSPGVTRNIMSSARNMKSKVAFEPVSVPKSGRIFEPSSEPFDPRQVVQCFPQHKIDLATPNQHELAAMHASAHKYEFFETDRWWQVIDSFGVPSSGARDRFVALTNRKMTDEGIPLQTIQLLPYIPTILTKLGAEGVLLTELLMPDDPRLTDPDTARYILCRTSNGSTEIGGVYMRLFPAMKFSGGAVSVNGVGDTFLGILVAGLAKGSKLDENLINIAQQGAVMTLQSKDAVSPRLAELAKGLDELAEA
jgi:pseudouridine-5'-phosphate glycosidase/pseudouridine kinase